VKQTFRDLLARSPLVLLRSEPGNAPAADALGRSTGLEGLRVAVSTHGEYRYASCGAKERPNTTRLMRSG